MKKAALFIVLSFLIFSSAFSHSGKARYHVIIDTDCAPDDLRAISCLLSAPEFEILAITCSDGLLKPEEGYVKIKAMLKEFGHEGIPVAYGKSLGTEKTECHSFCKEIFWGNEDGITIPKESGAIDLLKKTIELEEEKVVLICLGPMTNISPLLSESVMLSQIDRVIWYCDDVLASKGFNFQQDKKAAKVFTEANTNKFVVTNNNTNLSPGKDYMTQISQIKNQYAQLIIKSHSANEIKEKTKLGVLKLWDDLIPVFLFSPELFDVRKEKNSLNLITPKVENENEIYSKIFEIFRSKTSKESKVFSSIPTNPELFAEDVKPFVQEIIENNGLSEFRAGIIANELHGHMGIYAIIGVKMGIRVRQYFNIGVDEIHITTFAGSTPPISCMNDGLQVGTGGTIGHGLINISDEEKKRPEATFTFKNKTIKLRLKDEYAKQIREDVKTGIAKYGNLTPEYWLFIRELAIKYWKDFDRMEIFEIEEME